MNFVYQILVALHIVGVVAIGYGFFSQISKAKKEINPGILHGASLQFLTGMIMVGLRESDAVTGEEPLNMMIIGAKLAVVIGILVVSVIGKRTNGDAKPFWLAAGAMWIVNIALAMMV
jgi:hypothetical protein